jgi:hypothetical protein
MSKLTNDLQFWEWAELVSRRHCTDGFVFGIQSLFAWKEKIYISYTKERQKDKILLKFKSKIKDKRQWDPKKNRKKEKQQSQEGRKTK